MSQISGAFTVELDLERLADLVAARVVAQLAAGSNHYDRATVADPGRAWRGTRDNLAPGEQP